MSKDYGILPAGPADDEIPVATATTTGFAVEVVAPASLPEGYVFSVEMNGETMNVTVPPGGVERGQKFTVSVQRQVSYESVGPVGHWRDHWCNFCALGCCHPSVCLAFCCHFLALAQIMTRMKLNWFADPRQRGTASHGLFQTMILIYAGYFVVTFVINAIIQACMLQYIHELQKGEEVWLNGDDTTTAPEPPAFPVVTVLLRRADFLFHILFWGYYMIIFVKTRMALRRKYAIPEQACSGCEDFMCGCCCSCCSISQMARHTADYDKYPGQCCTENGLPPDAPAII